MAYYSNYRRRRRSATVGIERALEAQGHEFAQKAAVDLTVALGARWVANYFCCHPNPDAILCNVSTDLAAQQEQTAAKSMLTLGVWGGVMFGAGLIFAISES